MAWIKVRSESQDAWIKSEAIAMVRASHAGTEVFLHACQKIRVQSSPQELLQECDKDPSQPIQERSA